jgi:glutathione S-transferase
MIKIYGIYKSRAARPVWTAEELGIPYELVEMHYGGEAVKSDEYRVLNPNGKVPTLVDGDLILFESLAIDLYLAKKYAASGLWANDSHEEARILQWTLWAATEAEPLARQWFRHTSVLPEAQRNPAIAESACADLRSRFAVLEQSLQESDYLVGDRFTIADLNVAAVLQRFAQLGGSAYPDVLAWHERCFSRPAATKVFGTTAAAAETQR